MRSLNTRKCADKRVSIKSEVVENFELKNKRKNELATNTPETCTLHTHLHAGGAITRKGNNNVNFEGVGFICGPTYCHYRPERS